MADVGFSVFLAVEKAKAGFRTIGFDVQPQKAEMVNRRAKLHRRCGECRFGAPNVQSGMLRATSDFDFRKTVDFVTCEVSRRPMRAPVAGHKLRRGFCRGDWRYRVEAVRL